MNKNKLPFIFIGFLIIGLIGYYLFRQELIGYIFVHVGGASVVGLMGMLAAYIARRKGYSYKFAFNLGFYFSIVLGILAVFLVYFIGESKHIACGGSVSLPFSLIVIVTYLLFGKKIQEGK